MLDEIFPPSFAVAAIYVLAGSLLINYYPRDSWTRTAGMGLLAAASLPLYKAVQQQRRDPARGKGI